MSLPSVEVLEAHHDFPGTYTFKVIGTSDGKFTSRIIAAVRDELRMETDPPYTFRTTKTGNHVAITLEPVCENAQQVIAIYSRLTGMDGIFMLL
jgi:putative lipoic acid-binding regulatory protein